MPLYNIEYYNSKGQVFHYLGVHVRDEGVARRLLREFKAKYFLPFLDKPKPYPNGEGYYDIINPRVVRVA